jgi:sulfur relay (sulfurtransferase) complex TusBCD TusD component (DsrE family)
VILFLLHGFASPFSSPPLPSLAGPIDSLSPTAYFAPMSLLGKKLGLLLSTSPGQPGFQHGLRLAAAALEAGVDVYLYCIDDAVLGVGEPRLQSLSARGLKLYVCAYGAQKRGLPQTQNATYAGLALLSDLMAETDRFVSFN